jgi:predicted ATPase
MGYRGVVRLIGRQEECARIDRLLGDAGRGRSGALVLRGEAGIGKSALLTHALERAHDLEMETLRAAGFESEAELPFAALHALLLPKVDLLDLLPEPQGRALSAALALGPTAEADRLAAYRFLDDRVEPGEAGDLLGAAEPTRLTDLSEQMASEDRPDPGDRLQGLAALIAASETTQLGVDAVQLHLQRRDHGQQRIVLEPSMVG